MKIPKNKIQSGSQILSEQAERLSSRSPSSTEARTLGAEGNQLKRASRALTADYIQSIARPIDIKPGDPSLPGPLNNFFKDCRTDLEVLARLSDQLSSVLNTSYNVVATKENDVVGELKTLREKISALKLYSRESTRDDHYIVYTFSDGSRILSGEGTSLTYDEQEGALSLPVVGVKTLTVKSLEILPESNGVKGNNLDQSRSRHGNLNSIIDNQVQTWFEFERIANNKSGNIKLILHMQLETPDIINRIHITPANLGTSNWIRIEDIKLQISGDLVSIKDDIATPEWDSSSDPFLLSPASSKYAGEGFFTFTPALASAVQITFTQEEPIPILNGAKLRYAIALKEIELQQVEFAGEGSFLLAPDLFNKPIQALGLIQNINTNEIPRYSIEYLVTLDNGQSWLELLPQDNRDSSRTEAIFLDSPQSGVQLKGTCKRLSKAFEGQIAQGRQVEQKISRILQGFDISAPIALDMEPLSYFEIFETRYGGQGDISPYFLGRSRSNIGLHQVFQLPIEVDKDDISLLVSGEEWPRVIAFANETERAFLYDTTGEFPQIIIGDGLPLVDGIGGAIPMHGAELYLKLAPLKNPRFTAVDEGLKVSLKYDTDKVKDNTSVIIKDIEIRTSELSVGPGAEYILIPWEHADFEIVSMLTPETNYLIDASEVVFQNGEVEFAGLAEGLYYSIEEASNKIWLSAPVLITGGDLSLSYTHTNREKLNTNQWDFSPSENALIIKEGEVNPKLGEKILIGTTQTRILELTTGDLLATSSSIIKGSVRGVDLGGTGGISRVLETEVEFINGSTEFEGLRTISQSLLGFYSIDYPKRRIHLPRFTGLAVADQGFLPGKIIFSYISSEVHYSIGRKLLEGRDFFRSSNVVELTPIYLNRIAILSRRTGRTTDLHVRFNARSVVSLDGSLLEKFYSPIIRDIALIGIGLDPRLGTLESL